VNAATGSTSRIAFSLITFTVAEKVRKEGAELAMDANGHYEELMQQITIVKDRVRGVVHGHYNALYLYGRPGTSKTHTVCTTLDTLAVNYTLSNGHLTEIGLFDLLDENRDRIIVMDDVSAVFNKPIALQLLLAALGNPHDGSKTRYVRYKTARETRIVPFTGGLICISNLPLDGHHHEVLSALKSRAFVINYEPTDEQIIALIHRIAEDGVDGVPPDKARMVATFLIEQCKLIGVRPSVRLFVDKAIKDYKLFDAGKCEAHWRDLVVSNLKEQLVELQHETTDLSRAEQVEAERRIALDIYLSNGTRAERREEWQARTGKSEPAFYRRVAELKKAGRLPGADSVVKAG
jgi:hypothetical protein